MLQAPLPGRQVSIDRINLDSVQFPSGFSLGSGSLSADLKGLFDQDFELLLQPQDYSKGGLACPASSAPAALDCASALAQPESYLSRASSYDISSSNNTGVASRATSQPLTLLTPNLVAPAQPSSTRAAPKASSPQIDTAAMRMREDDSSDSDQDESDTKLPPSAPTRSRSQRTRARLPSKGSCMTMQDLEAQQHTMSDKDYRRMRRRITNRESASRMRRKRNEDMQTVTNALNSLHAENLELKRRQAVMIEAVQRMHREAKQWQVRAQGSQIQSAQLMQQMLDKRVTADASVEIFVTPSAQKPCQTSPYLTNVPPPTRATSPFPRPSALNIPQSSALLSELLTKEPSTPLAFADLMQDNLMSDIGFRTSMDYQDSLYPIKAEPELQLGDYGLPSSDFPIKAEPGTDALPVSEAELEGLAMDFINEGDE